MAVLNGLNDPTQMAARGQQAAEEQAVSSQQLAKETSGPMLSPPRDTSGVTVQSQGAAQAPSFQGTEFQEGASYVSPESTVSGQLSALLSRDNPYIRQARLGARREAAGRGLLNTSMAAGAGQAAAIKEGLPIAKQDALAFSEAQGRQQEFEGSSQLDAEKYTAEGALAKQEFNIDRQLAAQGFVYDTKLSVQENKAKRDAALQLALSQQKISKQEFNQAMQESLQDFREAKGLSSQKAGEDRLLQLQAAGQARNLSAQEASELRLLQQQKAGQAEKLQLQGSRQDQLTQLQKYHQDRGLSAQDAQIAAEAQHKLMLQREHTNVQEANLERMRAGQEYQFDRALSEQENVQNKAAAEKLFEYETELQDQGYSAEQAQVMATVNGALTKSLIDASTAFLNNTNITDVAGAIDVISGILQDTQLGSGMFDKGQAVPDIPFSDMTADQQRLANDESYLDRNPDVARAVASGQFASARDHYERYGKDAGREWGQ